ncbi:MAG: hypothetical protein CVV60_05485 [Tenericutes bacterium HGW-Tenericutes-5]|jgi:DNA-binding HxlR family transcriptional regulator|nr:MAG: hypothetical protein CVV60_05485 [Tenericutes bacterium HGW-Tenericutes-5]
MKEMKKDILKVMMHPLRIKIIQELAMKQKATTKEIRKACGDCSQATLYRHLKEMLEYDLIEVVEENNINGIIEKVYSIKTDVSKELMSKKDKMSKDDFQNIFNQFLITIMSDLRSYLEQKNAIEEIQNNIGLVSQSLFLSDEELLEMMREITKMIALRTNNEKTKERKLRKVSYIVTSSLEEK